MATNDACAVALSRDLGDAVVVLGGSMSIVFQAAVGTTWTVQCPSLADLFGDYAGAYTYLAVTAEATPKLAAAAATAAAFVKSAEAQRIIPEKVLVGLREGPCYFTDRPRDGKATPTLGQGDWAKIRAPGEGTGCAHGALAAFLNSVDTNSTTGDRPVTRIEVTAGPDTEARDRVAALLNNALTKMYQDNEPSSYFHPITPAAECYQILAAITEANTVSTRGLGFYYSAHTPPRMMLPGNIVYGFSGRESAARRRPPPPAAVSLPPAAVSLPPAAHPAHPAAAVAAQGRPSTLACSTSGSHGPQCSPPRRRAQARPCPTPPSPTPWAQSRAASPRYGSARPSALL